MLYSAGVDVKQSEQIWCIVRIINTRQQEATRHGAPLHLTSIFIFNFLRVTFFRKSDESFMQILTTLYTYNQKLRDAFVGRFSLQKTAF